MLTLAEINPYLINLGIVALVGVCVLMILVVLIQRPQGGGLSGAFGAGGGGGGGAGQTAFGTKTGDVLTYATITVFVLYLLVAIGLNFATRPYTGDANTLPVVTVPGTSDEESGDATPADESPEESVGEAIDEAVEAVEDADEDMIPGEQGTPGAEPADPASSGPALVDPASAEQP